MIRAGAAAVLAVVVLPACASTVQPTPSASAGASAAAGPLEIRGGELAPGTYTHSGFSPRITFDVGEGWHGVQNSSGFFDVQQDPDTPDVIAVQFGNVDAVFGESGSSVEIDRAADAVPIIRENTDFEIIGESPWQMSGLDGFTVEVENAVGRDVPVLRVPAGPLAISPERRLWVSFFDTPDGVLAVLVGGSVAKWDETLRNRRARPRVRPDRRRGALMAAMRAFVISGPDQGEVRDVEPPRAEPGLVVVEVDRVGLCGTDEELFSGGMSYLQTGEATYPVRPGHEWAGRVMEIGEGVDASWMDARVTGDTMLGDGTCHLCQSGRQHLCPNRYEIGIRRGWPGALAERLPVPERALLRLPDAVDPQLGALVEPSGNAVRALRAAGVRSGERLLVFGPGAIGCLVALFARADGVDVHLVGRSERSRAFAKSLGFEHVWTDDTIPDLRFDAAVDASSAPQLPARAIELVDPGRRVSLIGIAGEPSPADTRAIVFRELTVVGVLSASGGLEEAIERLASGTLDARPLVAATVGLDEVAGVLGGRRDAAWGHGPKVHVDPRR